jgi:hypothetical protein
MEPYKTYWIAGWALTVRGFGPERYARADVCVVEASGRTVVVKSFKPSETFSSKEEAEAHGLELCRKWVDQKEINDDFQIWTQCFGSKSF